jgi:hypothetical protein
LAEGHRLGEGALGGNGGGDRSANAGTQGVPDGTGVSTSGTLRKSLAFEPLKPPDVVGDRSAIDLATMADAHHQNHQLAALPFVDDAEPAAGVSQSRSMTSTTRTRSAFGSAASASRNSSQPSTGAAGSFRAATPQRKSSISSRFYSIAEGVGEAGRDFNHGSLREVTEKSVTL